MTPSRRHFVTTLAAVPFFKDVQQTSRKVRLQAPDQIQAAGFGAVQFDYCSDLNWMIGLMTAQKACREFSLARLICLEWHAYCLDSSERRS